MVAAIKAVKPPINNIKNNTDGANSNNGEHLIIRKTPAVTKVAAWIKADTGVGASIASGNQVCKPTWADLPTEPKNKKKQIKFKQKHSKPKKLMVELLKKEAIAKTTEKSTDLKK